MKNAVTKVAQPRNYILQGTDGPAPAPYHDTDQPITVMDFLDVYNFTME
jgi:hypothetical protein